MEHSSRVRSVERAIDILMALAQGAQTLGAICRTTGLSKGTGHRLLAGLAYRNLVIQEPGTGLYMLGPGALPIAEAVTTGLGGIGLIARPTLEHLRDLSGETVTLHIRLGTQRTCIEEVPSPHGIRYIAGVGSTAPVHVGAAGKVLLAFLPPAARTSLLRSMKLERVTQHTRTNADDLLAELEQVRREGWARSSGERVLGASAVSVPVRDESGEVVCALSILGPADRLTEREIERLIVPLERAASEIAGGLVFGNIGADGSAQETPRVPPGTDDLPSSSHRATVTGRKR
jgi:IclR family acetate operon transcriptional repressor